MRKALLVISTTISVLLLAVILVIGLPVKKSLATYQNDLQELQGEFDMQLQRSYQLAVEDAADALEDEIYKGLLPIVPDNPDLKWREVDGKPQVLMVTWSSWNGYDEKVGQKMQLTREVWTTAVPELQKFASQLQLNENNLNVRLEEYLGLPAHNGKTKFVQMWVYPKDLYRPCPDSEIDDTQCDLDFPNPVDAQHEEWINKQIINSYGEKGYPWTRLGYTYDWGRIGTEIGASEFVVRAGAEVDIDSVMNTVDYVRG
ncbi:MAG: hypothetical protein AAF915_17140 [Cyanobacteria bacterium P01_D01_bin.50]